MYLNPLVSHWELHLKAQGASPRTVAIYLGCIQTMLGGKDPRDVTPRDLKSAIVALAGASPAYRHQHYRVAKTFFRWLVAEDEISVSPVAKLPEPIVPTKPVKVLNGDEMAKLLGTCKGRGVLERRDRALILMFTDTGGRREEIARMTRQNVDLTSSAAVVIGKGRKPRAVYFTAATAEAVSRYLRLRRDTWPELWVGRQGPLQAPSIYRVIQRRGRQAGIPGLFPHMLRHTFASQWLESGGQEGDLMRLGGWSTRSMLDRYGASVADRRAASAYRRVIG